MSSYCSLCSAKRSVCFQAKILGKYPVDYLYCDNCGLLQTASPFWLEEAYSNAIADADTGLVSRNIDISNKLATILFLFFDKKGKYLDIAGGYGMLTRLMRDIGYDFYWQDKYCQNILAKGFDLSYSTKPFTAITAFEVLEHIYEPMNFIKEVMAEADSSSLIFSTQLFQGQPPIPDQWWYYSFNTGQHISFYQRKTFAFIANQLALNFYSNNHFHLLTAQKINTSLFNLATRSRISEIICRFFVKNQLTSKTFSDFQEILNQKVK